MTDIIQQEGGRASEACTSANFTGRDARSAALLVALIWGINIPAMKFAVGHFDPFVFNALRLTLSVLVLGWIDHRAGPAAGPTPWLRVLLIGLLASLGYQVVFILGIAHTTAGNTGLIIASGPLWTALIGGLAGSERLSRSAWSGLALAFVGTVVVAVEGGTVTLADTHWRGNLLVLCAALTWALATVLSRRVVQQISPTRLAFLFTVMTLPGHYALAATQVDGAQLLNATAGAWGAVFYAGVFSTGLAYALWNFSVRHVGPSHTAIYMNLVPVIALVVSWLALGERITPSQSLGGLLILGGLFVMARGRRIRGHLIRGHEARGTRARGKSGR